MQRKRRLISFLALLLPVALWALSGWSTLPASIESPQKGNPSDPDPFIQGILDQVTASEFVTLDNGLSGENPITIGGNSVTLTSRYTPSSQGTLAEQYVYEYFQSLGLSTSYQPWTYCTGSISGRNVVAEIPGTVDPSRIYLITGHLDTISPNPTTNAKGADDDGSGTVAVMMAARILKQYSFDYTLRFVAFTGEERGLCGSNRYAFNARNANEDIRGVVNMDMIAYDSNNVKDVEIHAGTLPASQAIANTFIQNISTYGLNLVPHLHTTDATRASDHASFWTYNYPAILGIEYYTGNDFNPWYHSYTCCDTMVHVDTGMATSMIKAGLATLSMLAGGHPAGAASPTPVATSTNTSTPQPAATNTPAPQATDTPVPPTATQAAGNTATPVPPQPTSTSTPAGCTASFRDVQPTDYFYEAVNYLVCHNVISGYSDNTFRPYSNITRGQAVKVLVLGYGWSINTVGGPHFTDVPANYWAYDYIETLYNRQPGGIISGYGDGTFRPANNMTRGQLMKVTVASAGWTLQTPPNPTFSDVPAGSAFYSYVETAYAHGIIDGYADGAFRPESEMTRGQFGKVFYGTLQQR